MEWVGGYAGPAAPDVPVAAAAAAEDELLADPEAEDI